MVCHRRDAHALVTAEGVGPDGGAPFAVDRGRRGVPRGDGRDDRGEGVDVGERLRSWGDRGEIVGRSLGDGGEIVGRAWTWASDCVVVMTVVWRSRGVHRRVQYRRSQAATGAYSVQAVAGGCRRFHLLRDDACGPLDRNDEEARLR